MIRTYIDSGVLIAALRGKGWLSERALAVLADNSREFVSSDFVRFETIPKATYFGRSTEVGFYEAFFSRVSAWFAFDAEHCRAAFDEACRCGLGAIDAIHVVLAELAGCDELVTTERTGSAIFRTRRVKVVSIDPR